MNEQKYPRKFVTTAVHWSFKLVIFSCFLNALFAVYINSKS